MIGWIGKSLDAIITQVSPERGNRRLAARARQEYATARWDKVKHRLSNGGFGGGEESRDAQSWYTKLISPDSALELDRDEMNQRADSAVKVYELGAAHQEGRVIRVVGCGMTIDPDIRPREGLITEAQADKWNLDLREAWERTAECIGPNGESLWEVQQLMQRYFERRGEWFLLIGDKDDTFCPTTLKVEVLDPDQIETPPGKLGDPLCRMGVQFDSKKEILGYWHREAHPGDTLEVKEKFVFYPAKFRNGLPRVIHHFAKWWKGQHRGFPMMQVGTKRLKNSEEYNEAEIERNYVASCFAGFYSTDSTEDELSNAMGMVRNSEGNLEQDIVPGTMTRINGATDSINFSNPSGAPASFEPFVQHQDRKFAAGVGSSYEILTNDWRNISYSAGRIIWNIEDAVTKVLQMGHKKSLTWIYRHFFSRCVVGISSIIDIDQVEYRDQPWVYWRARIIAPAKASIDPAREDRNELVKVEAGGRVHSDLVEQWNGEPADVVYDLIQRNKKLMTKYGINTTMPQMGRDVKPSPTQIGDGNQASSDANSERQATGAAA